MECNVRPIFYFVGVRVIALRQFISGPKNVENGQKRGPKIEKEKMSSVGNPVVSPSADMLPFGVTIPATVPQRS
jgi:hypothetical protein